jgi:DNA-binding ferritin-like protein
MLELTELKEEKLILLPPEIFQQLYSDIQTVINHLKDAFDVATADREQGIANFIADRIDAYEKHSWMIRSILKKV